LGDAANGGHEAKTAGRLPRFAVMADLGLCTACGAGGTGILLDGDPLCDRCADRHLAAIKGWPELPAPPRPEVVVGPDGRSHFIRYRMLRMPGGVVAVAEELGLPEGSGYRLTVRADHFDDPMPLLEGIRALVRNEIGRPYLEPHEWHGWSLVDDQVGGRLEEDPDEVSNPPHVVVDGHDLSWEDFGTLLRPYVGWAFHVQLGETPRRARSRKARGKVVVRQATEAEEQAAFDSLVETAGAYVLDSDHYPSPADWRDRPRPRAP
jgi:hypothetical protein